MISLMTTNRGDPLVSITLAVLFIITAAIVAVVTHLFSFVVILAFSFLLPKGVGMIYYLETLLNISAYASIAFGLYATNWIRLYGNDYIGRRPV